MTTNVEVHPEAMARAVTDMADVLGRLLTAVGDLRGLAVPSGSCGQVGAPVASASASLQSQSAQAMTSLHSTLVEIGRRLEHTLSTYHSDDDAIAAARRRLARLRPTTF
jgi:uncharacterized protein YukE